MYISLIFEKKNEVCQVIINNKYDNIFVTKITVCNTRTSIIYFVLDMYM